MLRRAVDQAFVHLTPEEQGILTRYSIDGLSTAIAEAQNAVVTAQAGDRDEADRRYRLTLNLAAKLAPPPEPNPPAVLERQRAYVLALSAQEEQLAQLPEPARQQKLSEFKDRFFADLETPPPQAQPSQAGVKDAQRK